MTVENPQSVPTLSDDQKQQIRQLRSYVEEAVGEMAYMAEDPYSGFDDLHTRIKKLRRAGVRDAAGALGDELFNESSTVSDLVGDRLYDLVHGTWNVPYENKALWNEAVNVCAGSMPHVKNSLIKILKR
ncbi:MAG: hypothetical protein CMB80_03590 [Flammeovirgaceae bacterium]|jgi:hypothetical protein|nr:hypothetical protein [Flammeovirgaceae bacterium]HCX24597.1 hypothetical protein [Cytophagales bacterium]|tara:strand:+ start:66 stop:452 length:387 start_codon:yes stop_codon:yes gene_type:complete